jgi:hypothetical protein
MDDMIPRILTLIFLISVISTAILAHRKNRDVGRWMFASLCGFWVTALIAFVGILRFADLLKMPEDERDGSSRRERGFCWATIIVGVLVWVALLMLI